jgi:hypothetical protein
MLIDDLHFMLEIGQQTVGHLIDLDFIPMNPSHLFYAEDIPNMKKYCKDNPEFHIYSKPFNSKYVNYYLEDAEYYGLANMNADPELTYFEKWNGVPTFEFSEDGEISVTFAYPDSKN